MSADAARTIMIVDDDESLRDSLCELLEEEGFLAVGVASGESALERLRSDPVLPDCIVLDLIMPELNGWQFREAQLLDPALAAIPVVVLSATRRIRGISADAIVTKPIDLASLLEVVRRHANAVAPAPVRPGGPSGRISDWFAGAGEMGRAVRAFDWSQTPLGAIETWPQSLRAAVDICLASRFPLWIGWGPELRLIYNAAYRTVLRGKHPAALGQPFRAVWRDSWDVLAPALTGVLERGESSWQDDQLLILDRDGLPVETYFTYSLSPIRDEGGGVGGVFAVVSETTDRVVELRRLQTLRALGEPPASSTVEGAWTAALAVLAANPADAPFAAIYLLDESTQIAHLATGPGTAGPSLALPESVSLARGSDGWPLTEVAATRRPQVLEDLALRGAPLPGGPWPEKSRAAVVLPLPRSSGDCLEGFLIAGISPRLTLDEKYRSFLDLAATSIATNLARARALEVQRRKTSELLDEARSRMEFFADAIRKLRTPLTLLLGPLEGYLRQASDAPAAAQRERVELAYRSAAELLELLATNFDSTHPEVGPPGAVPRALPVNAAREAAGPASGRSRESIVVIDGHTDLSGHVASVLAERWQVTTTSTITQTLDALFSHPRNLVVADEQAAGRDGAGGFELLARLRSDPRTATIPVMLLSARAGEEARAEGLSAGADDYLVQPFSGRELTARAAAVLSVSARRRQVEQLVGDTAAKAVETAKHQSMGNLAGGVAHEFNNLLTTVIGFTTLCLDSPELPDSLREYLVEVQQAAERSSTITRQLLAYGQRQPLRPIPLDVGALLERVAVGLPRLADGRSALQVDLQERPPLVLADPAQIEVALRHLVANAQDALAPGGVVSIAARVVDVAHRKLLNTGAIEPGRYLVMTVKDTGRGIDPASLARIFEPYFSTKAGGPSRGIGLSVVQGIVRQTGGHIRVRSRVGEGTTVDVYLPVAMQLAPPPLLAATAPSPHQLTALVVDDEPTVRTYVAAILRASGYSVLEAGNVPDALLAMERLTRFDLLITEVSTPRLNGAELAQRLRARAPALRVLFVSGHESSELLQQGQLPRGASLLRKPFRPAELRAQLQSLLGAGPSPLGSGGRPRES